MIRTRPGSLLALTLCRVALAAALVAVWLPVSGVVHAGTRRPDLVPAAIRKMPTQIRAGSPVSLRVVLKNAGSGRAGASVARFYLSWDGLRSRDDIRLSGEIQTPRLSAGRSVSILGKVKAPASAPAEPMRLIVCLDDKKAVSESNEKNNCLAHAGTIEVAGPVTSSELIADAEASGEITHEEALIYEMRNAFGYPELPARYRDGLSDDAFESGDILKTVAHEWNSLPPAAQATLEPYFRPPIYEGTLMDPGGSAHARAAQQGQTSCFGGGSLPPSAMAKWATIDTEHFRFYYYTVDDLSPTGAAAGFNAAPEKSKAVAEFLAAEAESIYEKEVALFGRAPLSDTGQPCGGDPRIDVFLYNGSVAGVAETVPYPPGSILRPGWMRVNPDYPTTSHLARDVFAHEFSHLIQLAYDYAQWNNRSFGYRWLEEASATWVVDYLFPADNPRFEHEFAHEYLVKRPGFLHELERNPHIAESSGTRNGYEDYLFFFYASHVLGDGTFMRTIWDNTERMNSVDAIEEGLLGQRSLNSLWHEFALYNLNRGDLDHYMEWDGIAEGYKLDGSKQPHVKVQLGGKGNVKIPLPKGRTVPHLAIKYTSFDLSDDKVRHVKFENFGFCPPSTDDQCYEELPQEAGYHRVQAWMEMADGSTKVEDWTDRDEVSFCRDEPAEDVRRLVLIYSNAVPEDYAQNSESNYVGIRNDGTVKARGACSFPETWTGEMSGSLEKRVLPRICA